METQNKKFEKQLKMQRIYTLLTIMMSGFFMLVSFKNTENFDVIRAKGIIIVDSLGHERILIGSPIPYAKNRVRTDLERVKQVWGKQMSPQYMGWYKNYNNAANGMVFLDDKGFDRIAIGESTPDPNIGPRIGTQTGIIINDERGFERSGYGLLNVEGQNRVVLGLDRKGGTEGVTLSIMEDGSAGLAVMHQKKMLFLGNATKDGLPVDMQKDMFGLKMFDTTKVKYDFDLIK